MDPALLVLLILLIVFLAGGVWVPRPTAGDGGINTVLYALAVVVLVIVVVRLLGVL